MPYKRETYFQPSDPFKKAWTLTPQNRVLRLSGHKARSMYATLSSAIPIYYVLAFLAISFDIYLGFSILAKSGVSIGLIVGSVLLDLLLAVTPFLLGLKDKFNFVYIENKLFKASLECKTRKINEDEDEYKTRINNTVQGDISQLKKDRLIAKIVKYVTYFLIFSIAFWKIFTYISILPPGFSIFSVVNGKIVIIFSILCAIFHIIGTEKAFAHLRFWKIKNSELKQFREFMSNEKPESLTIDIEFVGKYKPAKFVNTKLKVREDGSAYIEYLDPIWDDEIFTLMNKQGDENAKRGVVITCKQTQII